LYFLSILLKERELLENRGIEGSACFWRREWE